MVEHRQASSRVEPTRITNVLIEPPYEIQQLSINTHFSVGNVTKLDNHFPDRITAHPVDNQIVNLTQKMKIPLGNYVVVGAQEMNVQYRSTRSNKGDVNYRGVSMVLLIQKTDGDTRTNHDYFAFYVG